MLWKKSEWGVAAIRSFFGDPPIVVVMDENNGTQNDRYGRTYRI